MYKSPAHAVGTTVSTLSVHPNFIEHNKDKLLNDFYTVAKDKTGEGSFGSVFVGTHKVTKEKRAVKAVQKKKFNAKEIDVMKKMDHPNICKLFETFDGTKYMHLVMEMCEGGELFDVILNVGTFQERQAAYVMQSTLRALNYMHSHALTHRDLKPENFLVMEQVKGTKIEGTTIKLIDFGLATDCQPGQVLSTKAGTPYYVAPEVLFGSYSAGADNWSLGVIMYIILCGTPPFNGEKNPQILEAVRRGEARYPHAEWKNISSDAKELVKGLLTKNPENRYTAAEALQHVWITEKAPKAQEITIGSTFVDNLRTFRSLNNFKKTALQVIASNVKETKIKSLQEIFVATDKNGDGSLTIQELQATLEKAGLLESVPDLKELVTGIDANGSGVIDYREFLAATLDKRSILQDRVLWQAFTFFDKDDDGKISRKELQGVIADDSVKGMFAEELERLMNEVDLNGDGEIDFEEFKHMMIKDDAATAKDQGTAGNEANAQAADKVTDQPSSTEPASSEPTVK